MKSTSALATKTIAPETVVQEQLDAYNRRDLGAWLQTYSQDAEQYLLHAGLLASGQEQIRRRMVERFKDPALHARLVARMVMENIVVDHEFVTRTFPDGLATVEMLCFYEVNAGRITKATFSIGQARNISTTT